MPKITASELDLLTVFEVQPTLLDPAEPWEFNDALSRVHREGADLSFSVCPAYRDVHIVLERAGQRVDELDAAGVEDIRSHVDGARELLEVVLSARDKLLIRLKPHVSVHHLSNTRTHD